MKANPGGQMAHSEVVGRDGLIRNLWRTLERQSVFLSGERRMGKTSILRKVLAETMPDKLLLYRDLERVQTPLEFAEGIFQDLEVHLSGLTRTTERMRLLLTQFGGAELGRVIKFPEAVAPHWKPLLTDTLEDLIKHQNRPVILLWDELPLMLLNFKQRDGEAEVLAFLGLLRSLRQANANLRMVFASSIGWHNVLSMNLAGYANDPTNDMDVMDVPPLEPAAAEDLASQLLSGENVPVDDRTGVARTIAEVVDGMPFLIHHIVDQLVRRGDLATPATVHQVVNAALTDPLDGWRLRYFRDRILTYYAAAERTLALNLLDVLAVAERGLVFDDLYHRIRGRIATDDGELVRDVLMHLQRDHYVSQQTEGAYRFAYPFLQRCWKLQRGLSDEQ